MEKLTQRGRLFIIALTSLQEAIDSFKQHNNAATKEYRTYRDSVIQRFEYCTDIFWKFLNDYLRMQMGITTDIARPKLIFKESLGVRLITIEEFQICNKLIEDRNRTSHTYHEKLAEGIASRIPMYYQLMNTVAKRLAKE